MRNRGTFGRGNGGLWMIRKRRKVLEPSVNENNNKKTKYVDSERDDEPAALAVPACGAEKPGYCNSNSESLDYTDSFFQHDDDEKDAVCPITVTVQNIDIATTTTTTTIHRKNKPPRSSNRGMKRGTFGSRQRNMLTDSEISKKIRVALSQSSISQVSSSDDDDNADRISPQPQRRKLIVDASDDDDDDSPIASSQQKVVKVLSSHESLNSKMKFQRGSNRGDFFHPTLAAVRSFFAELDNVPLTMEDASRNPSAEKNYKLRTRRCKLPEPALQSEYAKYCAACIESGVEPLSIQHFAEQRARYFRQAEVFEGMFDE